MSAVKSEKTDARLAVPDSPILSSTLPSHSNSAHYMRQSNPTMNAHNNQPVRAPRPQYPPRPDPQMVYQEHMYTHAAVVQAIACASHDTLLRVGNSAYQDALSEAAEKRAVAQHYHQQLVELLKDQADRNAYTQVSFQQREQVYQIKPQSMQQTQSGNMPVAIATPSTSTTIRAPIPVRPNGNSLPLPHPIQALPVETHGPVHQPGGLKIVSRMGDWHANTPECPSDLPPQVFWRKSDWSGTKMTFVTDRQGTHLKHLVKGIRRIARQIWTEIDKTPGRCTGRTFLKNRIGSAFMDEYIGTIEEIYPCLKLCYGHWKALQVGITAYPHWYRSRNAVRSREI